MPSAPATTTATLAASAPGKLQAPVKSSGFSSVSLVPFLFIAVLGVVYWRSVGKVREDFVRRLKRDLNYHIALDLVLIFFTLLCYISWRAVWLKWVTWLALAVALFFSLKSLFGPDPAPPRVGLELPEDLRLDD